MKLVPILEELEASEDTTAIGDSNDELYSYAEDGGDEDDLDQLYEKAFEPLNPPTLVHKKSLKRPAKQMTANDDDDVEEDGKSFI
jgi:hypothetical protein